MKKFILTALLLISFTLTGCGGPSASERYNVACKRANEIRNFIFNGEAWKENITITRYKELINEVEKNLETMKSAANEEPKLVKHYNFERNSLEKFVEGRRKDIQKCEKKGYTRLKG